jgi:hypothetical protein
VESIDLFSVSSFDFVLSYFTTLVQFPGSSAVHSSALQLRHSRSHLLRHSADADGADTDDEGAQEHGRPTEATDRLPADLGV